MLERLTAKQPDPAAAGFLLGAAYERTGQRGKAVAEFRRVLELDPDFHAALNYLGYTYAESGENLEEALALVAGPWRSTPTTVRTSIPWVGPTIRLGRPEQARGYLERAAPAGARGRDAAGASGGCLCGAGADGEGA